MAEHITRKRAISIAKGISRPETIGKHQWRGVKSLLVIIAEHYPHAFPGQDRLAEQIGCDVRSIRRYVALAREHGLLLVEADMGQKRFRNNFSKTNRYHIVDEDKLTSSDEDKLACKGSFGTSLREVPQSQASPLSSREARQVRAAPARIVSREEPSRQVGKDSPPLRSKTRTRPKASELVVASGVREPGRIKPPPSAVPWRRLAEVFVRGWMEMIETTTPTDHLRDVRPLDSLRHCQRYLNAHFLGPEALTPKEPEEIAAMMSSFHTDVYRGQVRIKDGQSAWMAFTGAWGRHPNAVNDTSDKIRDFFNDYKKEQP